MVLEGFFAVVVFCVAPFDQQTPRTFSSKAQELSKICYARREASGWFGYGMIDISAVREEDFGDVLDTDVSDVSAEVEAVVSDQDANHGALKSTVVSSPIVMAIYKVNYSINKPVEGLEELRSENDGNIMTSEMVRELNVPEGDSFNTDGFDSLEADMLKYTESKAKGAVSGADVKDDEVSEDYQPELDSVVVRVHQSYISTGEDSVFPLPAAVRACNVLPGASLGDGLFDEDTLVVTVMSQLVLLIRFFAQGDRVVPYVVQSWRTSHPTEDVSALTTVGREILVHKSGSVIALPAQKDIVRLYYCAQTRRGVMLDQIHNLVVDGTILHSCFLDPLKDVPGGHAMLCVMMITSQKRYVIRLYEWWIDERRISEHTPLLLNNDFEIPVFVIPFKQRIFMMMPKSIIVVGINNILSADKGFLGVEFPGSFPVSCFRPTTPIIAPDPDDEVLIATEDGTIYSVVIYDEKIHIRPILRIPKISKFILEKRDSQYHLVYSRDLSYGGCIVFDDIVRDSLATDKLEKSQGHMILKWDNWAPLWDVSVVMDKDNNEELWLAHGKYLSLLKRGYSATKEISDSSLKRASKVYMYEVNDSFYFIFSFVDKTLMFRLEDDSLVEINDNMIDMLRPTLYMYRFGDICIQVTDNSIMALDFYEDNVITKDFSEDIVMAHGLDEVLAVISEDVVNDEFRTTLTVHQLETSSWTSDPHKFLISASPNFVRVIAVEYRFFIVIGFQSSLAFWEQTENGFEFRDEIVIPFKELHDLVQVGDMVYLSTRYGKYICYNLHINDESIDLEYLYHMQLCTLPIEFHLANDHILLISKGVWRLEFNSKFPVPIIFQETKERCVFSCIHTIGSKYAMLRDDGFTMFDVSSQYAPVLKTISLGKVPKKIQHICHLNVFAIMTESTLIFSNKHTVLETRLFSRKQNRSVFGNETLHHISEWILPTSEKSFRNILVACSNNNGGTIKVLQPKVHVEDANVIECFEIYSIKAPEAVLVVEQLNDNEIIYSSGSTLYKCQYDHNKKKMSEPISLKLFNELITGISVGELGITVTTKDLSVHYYNKTLDLWESNVLNRGSSSITLDRSLSVVSNKMYCFVSGYVSNDSKRFTSYTGYISRLKKCKFSPLWYPSPLRRFLSFGIGGDIDVFTMLTKNEYEGIFPMEKLDEHETSVTRKGLWKLDEFRRASHRDEHVLHSYALHGNNLDEELQMLLHSVSI